MDRSESTSRQLIAIAGLCLILAIFDGPAAHDAFAEVIDIQISPATVPVKD